MEHPVLNDAEVMSCAWLQSPVSRSRCYWWKEMDWSVCDALWNASSQFWGPSHWQNAWAFFFLEDFPQLKQWICLLIQPAICLRPKRQIFLLEKKNKKKKLGWTIRPSKEDTKCRILCGNSEMNEFFWMLSNCSEFWDYCNPHQLHSRDKCVRSLTLKEIYKLLLSSYQRQLGPNQSWLPSLH